MACDDADDADDAGESYHQWPLITRIAKGQWSRGGSGRARRTNFTSQPTNDVIDAQDRCGGSISTPCYKIQGETLAGFLRDPLGCFAVWTRINGSNNRIDLFCFIFISKAKGDASENVHEKQQPLQQLQGKQQQHEETEELAYGPGIVNKLKSRYLNRTLRDRAAGEARSGHATLRRAASLEDWLDKGPLLLHQPQFPQRVPPESYHNSSLSNLRAKQSPTREPRRFLEMSKESVEHCLRDFQGF